MSRRPVQEHPASRPYAPHPQSAEGFVHYRPAPAPGYYPRHPVMHLDLDTPAATKPSRRPDSKDLATTGGPQAQIITRLNRIEGNVHQLTTDVASVRSESRGAVAQIAQVLQKSHELSIARLKRVEKILGMGPEMKDQKTLLDRFDLLSFAVEELLERVKDPEANLPDGPLHHDMATSPFKRTYADAGIFTKTPTKPRLSSVAESQVALRSGLFSLSPTDVSPTDFFRKSFCVHYRFADDGSFPPKNLIDRRQTPFRGIVSQPIPKPTFTSVSPVARALVPADWDQRYDPSQQPFSFNPDQSSEGMEAYSVLSKQSSSIDGTIASLRQAAIGDRFVPSMSTPFRSTSVHPISPAPPGSPSQSPRQIPPFPSTIMLLAPLPPARPALSRSPTVEAEDVELKSPSADTLQEELSVLDMMGSPQSEMHSNIASPAPWRPRASASRHVAPCVPSVCVICTIEHGYPAPPSESERRSISVRLKKRKAKAQEAGTTQEQGPPPKRRKSKAGLGLSAKQEKARKKIKKVKAEGDPVMWPEMTPEEDVDPEFVGKFIGCDRKKCERWYHFACLGIGPGDSRLEGEFLCPVCCDKFFVPCGIFGRYTKLSSTHGRVSLWLVFWEGRDWEPTRPSDEAVEEFERRAAEEGINLDDDSVSCIMLSEAREGGVNNPELI
ncbi:hypothetical protein B0H14DRAFT_2761200 [Mycena olivaceomarginata]|nr:hypothetical protein B0H14DRAFT_2761200 [Mycena olivaceomarginata]